MAGYLLHQSATLQCVHGGAAQATAPNPSVKVDGQATVVQSSPWTISGCSFTAGSTPMPCLTAQWVSGTTRVTSNGQPLLLQDCQASCPPNGTGVTIISTQTRVKAT